MLAKNLDNLFYKIAVHQCDDFVIITDANALIVYANPSFENYTGYKLRNIRGKNISIVKSGLHNDTFYKKLWSDLKKGKPVSKVFINKKKNGELHYEFKTITPIRNAQNKVEYFLSTSKDYTSEFNLRREIIHQHRFIESVVKHTDALIVGLNRKGEIVLFNESCERLTGYRFSDVKGKNIFDLFITGTAKQEIRDIFDKILLKDKKYKKYEAIWTTKNRKELLIRWSNTIFDETNSNGLSVLSTGINITKEKEAENKLIALNASLDEKVKIRTKEVSSLNKHVLLKDNILHKINTSLPAVIYYLNIKTKKLILVNNRVNDSIILPFEKDIEIGFKEFSSHLSTPQAKEFTLNSFLHESSNKEYVLTLNTETFFLQHKAVVFENDKTGKPLIYLGVLTDISYLKTIQNRLEETQKIAHIGTWERNLITNEMYWSDEIYNIFEIDRVLETPTYSHFFNVIHSDDKTLFEDTISHCIKHNTAYEIVYRLETRPGRVKFVIEKGNCYYDKNGIATRIIGTVRDISETEYNKKRLEEVQKLAQIGIWEYNVITKELLISELMYSIYDVKSEKKKITLDYIMNQIHPEDKEHVVKVPQEAALNKENYMTEFRIFTDSGNTRHVVGRGFAEYNSNGDVIKLIGSIQDITKDMVLRNKLLNYDTTFENSISAIFTAGINGNIEYANAAAVRMWGYDSREEMLKDRPMVFQYWAEEERAIVMSCFESLLKQGTCKSSRPYKGIQKDNTFIFIDFNAIVVKDHSGLPIALTASFMDVTDELKIKREVEDHDKKLNLLLGNIDEVVYGLEVSNNDCLSRNVFFLSGKAEEIMGFSHQDLLLDKEIWFNQLHPDDIQLLVDSTFKAVSEKTSVNRVHRMFHKKTQKLIWIEDKLTPEFNEKGEVVMFYGSARDVTDRILKENLLKESEEKYRLLSDNNQDLITLRDISGKVLFISNSVEKVLGYTVKEYSEINPVDIVHPDDLNKLKSLLFGSPMERKEKGVYEARLKHKNGKYFWMNTISSPVFDQNGDVKHIIGSTRDITAKKTLELSLIESEEKYRSIYENALVGIFRIQIENQKPIDANSVCIKLFGYDSKDDFLENFNAAESYADSVEGSSIIKKVNVGLTIKNQEVLFKKKNGTMFWGNTSIKLLPGENIMEGVVVDVTLSKIYEAKLKQSLEEKDTLLKEVHHRVKNNLQIITSLLKLQLQKTEHPVLKEALTESRERIKSIALIHEKLYLGNDISVINFSEYLETLAKSVNRLHKDKNVSLVLGLDDFETNIDIAIPLALICHEIISNSYKHAFKNSNNGLLSVSLKKEDYKTCIHISDNGSGFEIDTIDETKSLGWRLINNLSKQAKAIISIKSISGEGSVFTVDL